MTGAQIAAAEYEISSLVDEIKSLRAQKSHNRRWINQAKQVIANSVAFKFNPAEVAEYVAHQHESIARYEATIAKVEASIARWTERVAQLKAQIAEAGK